MHPKIAADATPTANRLACVTVALQSDNANNASAPKAKISSGKNSVM
jgi:hypothetical protein